MKMLNPCLDEGSWSGEIKGRQTLHNIHTLQVKFFAEFHTLLGEEFCEIPQIFCIFSKRKLTGKKWKTKYYEKKQELRRKYIFYGNFSLFFRLNRSAPLNKPCWGASNVFTVWGILFLYLNSSVVIAFLHKHLVRKIPAIKLENLLCSSFAIYLLINIDFY